MTQEQSKTWKRPKITLKSDFIAIFSVQMTKFQHQTINLETTPLPVATQVTCLGVVFDCELTFSKHVTSVVRRCFYHLRQIRAVRKSLTTESVKMLVNALIASRLDYCNGVFLSAQCS